jgi:AraC family transcriptional activator FtrA
MRFVFPLFDGFTTLDVIGPYEVFRSLPGAEVVFAADAPGPVRDGAGSAALTAGAAFADVTTADVLVVPGGPGARRRLDHRPLLDWLRALHATTRWTTSVCTGSLLLGAAGLLDGRTATTHWAYADRLAELHPKVTVDPDRIYVVDGPIATSAGSSAAIDLCLHLIRTAHGADVANRVARELVVPAHRSGGQAQYTPTPVTAPRLPGSRTLGGLLEWAAAHLDADLSVDALAFRAAMSTRTFVRHFQESAGVTPAAWVREQRVRLAEQLLERDDATVSAIARRCGFGSADTLRRQFRRVRGVTPEQYRTAFRTE